MSSPTTNIRGGEIDTGHMSRRYLDNREYRTASQLNMISKEFEEPSGDLPLPISSIRSRITARQDEKYDNTYPVLHCRYCIAAYLVGYLM
jgi:hypothetical protein